MNQIINPHIVSSFSNELSNLSDDILRMGGIAELMVIDGIRAALKDNTELGNQVITRDLELDELENEMGRKVVRMLALRQPMATDLRFALAALKTAHNLERIGDLAKNIARRTGKISGVLPLNLASGIQRMSEQIIMRLHTIMDAFAVSDQEKAIAVWESDDEIDMLHDSLMREILMAMHEDTDNIDLGTHLMFIVKNFERIGDHCTNIAEEIYYRETGDILMRDQTGRH